jgi:hypothetical protein
MDISKSLFCSSEELKSYDYFFSIFLFMNPIEQAIVDVLKPANYIFYCIKLVIEDQYYTKLKAGP